MRRDRFPPVALAPAAFGCGVLAVWAVIVTAFAVAVFWPDWGEPR